MQNTLRPVAVIPQGSQRATDTNGFTIGKRYEIVGEEGNGALVKNDNGHVRFVLLDGSMSAHIVGPETSFILKGVTKQKALGYFEVVFG